jgi:hypothetical protein
VNFALHIDPGSLAQCEAALRSKAEALRVPVQSAMADAFKGIVDANFGSAGLMRPEPWQQLSKDYARKVGRAFATLYVTGALKDTVYKDASDPDAGKVGMTNTGAVPYALAHHNGFPPNFGFTTPGSGELPARRVFPVDVYTEKVTGEAAKLVEQAACAKVKELLK